MYENFRWKIITIAFIILGCAAALYFKDINRGLDLKGGSELLYEIDVSKLTDKQQQDIQDQAKEVLTRRLNILGLQDIKLRESGRYGITIQIPATMDKTKVRRIVERSGELFFKLASTKYDKIKNELGSNPDHLSKLNPDEAQEIKLKIQEILQQKKEGKYDKKNARYDVGLYTYYDAKNQPLKDKDGNTLTANILLDNRNKHTVSGNLLSNAYPTTDQFGRRAVGFELQGMGADKFYNITSDNKGALLSIVLDGNIKSMPVIEGEISNRGIIQGKFTKEEIQELVIVLKAGALPAKLRVPPSEFTIGPGLGKDSIRTGWIAISVAFIGVFVFMLIYYRVAGILANIALLLNLLIIMAFMALYHATLTLPGIAGILLTVGMSVDANILIFERIREELSRGKTLRHAVNLGFDKAFWAIFDANLTTLITSLILFQIGTGPIKGFAVTLSVGIFSSMLTALFVSRVFFGLLIAKDFVKKIKMMRLLETPSIPFVNWRRIVLSCSLIFIFAGMVHLVTVVKGTIFGIDFTGGSLIQLKLKEPLKTQDVKRRIAELQKQEYQNAEVQAVQAEGETADGTHREYQIRVRTVLQSKDPILLEEGESDERVLAAYLFTLKPETKKGPPFGPTVREDMAGRGVKLTEVNRLPEVKSDKDLQNVSEREQKIFERWNIARNPHWTLEIIASIPKTKVEKGEKVQTDIQKEIKDYYDRLEGYLLGRNYEIVREGMQGDLKNLFQAELAPQAFSPPAETKEEDRKDFVKTRAEEKDGSTVALGKLQVWINLETGEKATEEGLKEAFTSSEMAAQLKKKGLDSFDGEQVEVLGLASNKDNEYVKTFRVLAGTINEKDVDNYRTQVRAFFQDSDNFTLSEPFPRIDRIGSAVASNLKAKAFWAIVFSIFAIIAYITIRFEFTFGIGAVAALVHDLLLTLGLVAFVDYHGILEIKINLPIIAAFLTILGYSLNDTIVVFDRIRENMQARRRKEDYITIVNSSLNQTLSRTVLTSVTTFLVVTILFICGVKVIQGFAFTMMVGVVVGTYSSIFVATPVVIFYNLRAKEREKNRRKQASKKKKKKK